MSSSSSEATASKAANLPPSLPGLVYSAPLNLPEQAPTESRTMSLEEYSHATTHLEYKDLKIPTLHANHFSTDTISLVLYSAHIITNNSAKTIPPSVVIGHFINSVKQHITDVTQQQKWFDQINCPEVHNLWQARGQPLYDTVPQPIDTSLYRPEHLPFSGKSHNTIRMVSPIGPVITVPYYGHISLKRLNYFHLLKALPDLNPHLPPSYLEEQEFIYNTFAGIIQNIFYFETEQNKKAALSQIQSGPVKAHWLGASFRKNLTGHAAAQAVFKTPALDRVSIPSKTEWRLKDGIRHRVKRNRRLRPGAERARREGNAVESTMAVANQAEGQRERCGEGVRADDSEAILKNVFRRKDSRNVSTYVDAKE
ncbi:MAG: hypothetical protein M1836_002187 [Candelina mexicana]|nr:MAG: hypothetical protein M1836_002187 [Candelina mexicana]